jgi:hypothetical protein
MPAHERQALFARVMMSVEEEFYSKQVMNRS